MQKTGKRILYALLIAIPVVLMVIFMNVIMMKTSPEVDVAMLVVKNLMAFVLIGIYVYYVFLYHRKMAFNKMLFLIVSTALMITICLVMVSSDFLFMPMLISVMLIALVIDRQLAIVTHVVSVLLVGIIGQLPVLFFVFYITVGIVGAMLILMARERNKIFLVAAIVSAFNAIFYNIISYVLNEPFSFTQSLTVAGNGALTIIIVVGSMPFWETIFQVVTPLKLMEFVNSDHKLLQRLLMEAPGTYHHSRMVSSLAERAATHVGADALLARTGALYHDIGKLKEPMYFIENQDGRGNPHDEIAADASASIIIDHVEHGVKLGKEHKLPKAIVDIIAQHHGTSLVGYFYHKAQQYDDGVEYDEAMFRYDGPKPQTNEAAIVMLADCVEAYVRSLQENERDLDRIKTIIKEVIEGKLKDHQLEGCDLKIKELPLIADAFIQVYNGMYHERVKYPTNR